MRRWWRAFGWNRRPAVEQAPLVSPVAAADVERRPVAVVADELVQRVVEAVTLGAEVHRFATVAALWSALAANEFDPLPRLVVLAQAAASTRDELAVALAYLAPRTPVVLLHRRDELEELGECYLHVVADHPGEADANAPVEVLFAPGTGTELVAALRAAAPADLTVDDCPTELAGPLGPPPPDSPRGGQPVESVAPISAAPAPAAADVTEPPPSVVVAVVSAKGGAGKTTTAVELAATLARSPGRRVCLVDVDVRDRQLATLFGQQTPNAATLLAESDGITDATVLAHLVRDERLRVSALLAPPQHHDEAELLAGEFHRQVIGVLRRHFDVIVLDCPVTYREPLLAGIALVEADRIAAVTTLAVTSLAGLDRLLRTIVGPVTDGGLGVPRRKVGVVVNGALNGVAIDRADLDRYARGHPVVSVVPHAARDVLIATNTHRLDLLLGHPDLAPAYRNLAAWCTGFRGEGGPTPTTPSRQVA